MHAAWAGVSVVAAQGVHAAAELTTNPPEGIHVGLKDEDLFHWTVMVIGPPGTY